MKKSHILFVLFTIVFAACKQPDKKNELITNLKNNVSDTAFIRVLNNYIQLNKKSHQSRFIQVFVNYEQNISRYVFFTTKSMYDLKTQIPYDYFYYKDHIVLLYTGLDYLFKTKKSLPGDFHDFIKENELFKDIDSHGNFTSEFTSENIALGNNSWELRVYHSFNDSIVLNTNYEGRFIWNGSRVTLDTGAKFVAPVIYEDKVDGNDTLPNY